MGIRKANAADIGSMVRLSDLKRTEYEAYSPVFWRKAPDANAKQEGFFQSLLKRPNALMLVNEEQGEINGFVIANVVDAPPVYAPGGKVCLIDDFTVAEPELWQTIGKQLRDAAIQEAKSQGAILCVTVCGHLDGAKHDYLQTDGAHIASEWYVQEIG